MGRTAMNALFADLDAEHTDQLGGFAPGYAPQAHWSPEIPHTWRCWAQVGPTWSNHCGAEVPADDPLGLCERHREQVVGPRELVAA